MTSRVLICSLLVLIGAALSLADSLVVAGHMQKLPASLLVEGDEVLAPALSSLRLLGADDSVQGSAISISTADNTLRLKLDSQAAKFGERDIRLSAAPRLVNGEVYLPMRSLAPWLGVEVRFDPETHSLAVHPLLTITYETRDTGVAVIVRSNAPLQYSSGRLSNPSRAYFDFKHVSLGLAEQQVPVSEGCLERIRLAQFSFGPNVVRMVLDLNDPSTGDAWVNSTVEDRGRQVAILVGQRPLTPDPFRPVTADGPVKLIGAFLTPNSTAQSELTVLADGPTVVKSDFRESSRQLVLTVENGLNTLPAGSLPARGDKVVEKIESNGSATQPGTQLIVTLKDKDAGYLIRNEGAVVTVLMGTFSISDMVIVLDPGHGGHDTGAVGVRGTREKDLNLDIALRAQELLKGTGARVYLTRQDDTFIELGGRPALANRVKADVFISIHHNSTPVRNSASGTQTYYRNPDSAALAADMHAELIRTLELKNSGIRTANFKVLRESNVPAVLLEIAFINNSYEEGLLRTPEFRQKAAQAIVNGIRRYSANRKWRWQRSDLAAVVASNTGSM